MTEAAPVDLERLQQAFGDAPEEFHEILDIHLTQMSENLDRLDKAIRADDASLGRVNCAQLRRAPAPNCGMTAVVELFDRLERMGREKQLTEAGSVAAKASQEFARPKHFLQERFQSVLV